jgi:hypothetical protein
VRPATAVDRRSRREFLEQARLAPPGPQRDAFLDAAEKARVGPAEEIAVYLDERP